MYIIKKGNGINMSVIDRSDLLGANAVAGLTENAVNCAIEKHGSGGKKRGFS
jgi:hypothetical protein